MKQIHLSQSFTTAIVDFDIGTATERDIAAIRELMYSRKVVALKNQPINRDAFLDFARRFGEPEQFRLKNYHDPDYPDILVIDNRNGGATGTSVGARKIGNMWHSDSSYLIEPLPLTFLHAQRLPDGEGRGDTLFVDMQEALRTLPAHLRARIEGRQAKHDVRWTYKVKQSDLGESVQEIFQRLATSFPAISHPTIVRHGHTGQEALYLSPGYTTRIEGYSDEDSRALLDEIFVHVLQPKHIFTYHWEANDLLIWDNRSVIHCATDLPRDAERVMHRISINDGGFFSTREGR
ncbi:TauD/TfdA family dioxygenase [Caballeronia novacaledonica]|uniref:TauD/TfdA family dioxygenase n=1 Tax=Caballeronia novacaledonica TaxID=1544861 RepID=A0AA37I6X5_9BURK|nr:TauD/TfdA family dioxygenase [Caballeronia novacaledonica]GJH24550.1 TauD/TfdA family dioxygenase [Caballeronia novacaledonica]